jgi:hypothetical protein
MWEQDSTAHYCFVKRELFFCEKVVKQQIIAIVRLKSLILFMKIAINQRNNNIKYKIQIPLYANAEFRFNCRI